MKHLILLISFFLLPVFSHAQSAPVASAPAASTRYACQPSPLGTGTKALVRSGTKGDLIAWYCPGQDMPAMVVCVKSSCGLVAMKRAVATFASDPSLDGLNAAMAPYQRNAYTDPELVAVWAPYADEIRKLAQ